MAIKNLTKPFRIIWNADKSIQTIGEFPTEKANVTGTNKSTCAEFDAKDDLIAKIQSEELIFTDEQKQDPEIQKIIPAEMLK